MNFAPGLKQELVTSVAGEICICVGKKVLRKAVKSRMGRLVSRTIRDTYHQGYQQYHALRSRKRARTLTAARTRLCAKPVTSGRFTPSTVPQSSRPTFLDDMHERSYDPLISYNPYAAT